MIINHFQHGQSFEDNSFLIFYGNKYLTKDSLFDLFPNDFAELHQTHEDVICEQTKSTLKQTSLIKADAHYTAEINLGLLIKTADCMPICVFDHSQKKALAIHAGWRGIANQITIKAIKKAFPTSKKLSLVIGPYIHQESFEVDPDVKEQILSIIDPRERKYCYLSNENHSKYFIDLKMVLMHNLKASFKDVAFDFNDVQINSVTDLRFNSYRRDKDKSGRNYSFILIK